MPSVRPEITQLLSFLPMPQDDTSISGNYIATGSEKFDSNQFDTRVDYTFSERMHFFGRYTLANFSHFAPGAYGVEAGGPGLNGVFFAGNAPARNQSIALRSYLHRQSDHRDGLPLRLLPLPHPCVSQWRWDDPSH